MPGAKLLVADADLPMISKLNVLTDIPTVPNGREAENAPRIPIGCPRTVADPATSAQLQEPKLAEEGLSNNSVRNQLRLLSVLPNVNLLDASTRTSAVNSGASKDSVPGTPPGCHVIAESLVAIVFLKITSTELAMTIIGTVLLGPKEENAKRTPGCWRTASFLVRPVSAVSS